MERLTYWCDNGHGGGKWFVAIDAEGREDYGPHVDRLAAYEETGLEPGEIEQLKGEAFGLRVDKQELEQYRALGPIDRLRELAQADREGISPCTFCKFNPPLDIVNSAPTIDAVRAAGGCYCQECKYADYPIGPNILCKKFYGAGSIDGFCYWGQQKEADHEVSE